MDAAFSKAANPTRLRICRLDLEPLTLGHRFLLAQHGCAYVTDEKPDVTDLLLAVFICSMPWRQSKACLDSLFFRALVWPLWCNVWFWGVSKKCILPVEHSKFAKYWEDAHACPQTTSENTTEQEVNTPYEHRVLVMLMADFHMSRDQAMDTTLVEANAMWATQGERRGAHQIYQNKRRAALWEFARRMDAIKFGKAQVN